MKKFSKLLGIVLSLVLTINISLGMSHVTVFAESNVATVWVVAYTKGTGHAYIAVRNNTSHYITVGKYNLAPYDLVTCGKFGNMPDGKCLYYNLEKYRMWNGNCSYTPNYSLYEDIDSEELNTLSNKIVTDTKWTLTNNCASFAARCWNSISSREISAGWISRPKKLKRKIKKKSGDVKNITFKFPCTSSDVWYQTSQNDQLRVVTSLDGSGSSGSSSR